MFYLLTLLSLSLMINDPDPTTLKELQWKNRILLIFPGEQTKKLPELAWAEDLEEKLADRDLIYFTLGDSLSGNSDFTFSESYRHTLRKKYAPGCNMGCYVLIGKDGGAKLKKEQARVNWAELFATIDAMPMRIREMKRSENGTRR
ncbi:protein of unknown function [Cyclobacterium lianum]|uniref:DUF4174 domain-containing protein n=1 Tax=Cyclobacterium lianum TaxID=388280 RepID=A0A1M7P6J8_9BACT|nr:DUF4174 domain-containing protein [Cyclobacterium lianum]SHN12307.1 protein of unknown function [Cyclobacterium lianum]